MPRLTDDTIGTRAPRVSTGRTCGSNSNGVLGTVSDSQPLRTKAVSAHALQQEPVSPFCTLALPRPSSSLYHHSWSPKHEEMEAWEFLILRDIKVVTPEATHGSESPGSIPLKLSDGFCRPCLCLDL